MQEPKTSTLVRRPSMQSRTVRRTAIGGASAAVAGGIIVAEPAAHAAATVGTALVHAVGASVAEGAGVGLALGITTVGLMEAGRFGSEGRPLAAWTAGAGVFATLAATGALAGLAAHDLADGIPAGLLGGAMVAGFGSVLSYIVHDDVAVPDRSVLRRMAVPPLVVGLGATAATIVGHLGVAVPDPAAITSVGAGGLMLAAVPYVAHRVQMRNQTTRAELSES